VKPAILIANPENRRAGYFADACRRRGLPEPRVLPWRDVLRPGYPLAAELAGGAWLRIESPGENFQVERELLRLGSPATAAEGGWPSLAAPEAATLAEDHGRLRFQRQWYHGWVAALKSIRAAALTELPMMNPPEEIGVLFDKAATQHRLATAGVPVARNLGICRDFEDLRTRMAESRTHRVFLKPCHGSSASGVVALATNGRGQWQAVISAHLTVGDGEVRLHNSLRLQSLKDAAAIARLVDAVCRERALAERWFPKDSLDGRVYDLRIVVIAGRAAHLVVRTSRSPLTNLHLGNARGDPTAVRQRLGEAAWHAALRTAEDAAACFPACHYLGVDLMVGTNRRSFRIAEINAFGDLLPGILDQGMDTYEAQLHAWRPGQYCPHSPGFGSFRVARALPTTDTLKATECTEDD
jgi:glutathione synthase/RimK-type ligase-like ATP-grasp enzyme